MVFFKLPQEIAATNDLTALAARDREGFRLNAAKAYRAYSKDDRALLGQLETPHITAYDILIEWKNTLQPLAHELQTQRLKPTLSRTIAKYLALNEDEAEAKADTLIKERFTEAREQLVPKLYPLPKTGEKDALSHPRRHAHQLLAQPETELEALYTRYSNYLLHHQVATAHAIAVVDPYSGWWHRAITARRVKKERKLIHKTETARLIAIHKSLSELFGLHDGLVGALSAKGWDIIPVLSLRQQYEKQLRTVASDTAAARFALFEKTVKTFRDIHLQTQPDTSLTATYTEANEITALLLRVFELSNVEKNQFILTMKEVRELTEEKARILEAQAHRHTILQA